jgi:hypothetical protein
MAETSPGDAGCPTANLPSPRRRKDPRHPWRYRGATKVLIRTTLQVLQAQSLNLSLRGMGLVLPQPLEAGTLLAVFPPKPQAAKACALTARVVRIQPQAQGRWYLGCELLRPLSNEELEDFLA